MKRIKKASFLTKSRDWIRALFVLAFYGMVLIPHLSGCPGYEMETEYVVMGSILIFGPWFCGWACPFGNASYFMARLGNIIFPKWQFQIPNKYHKVASFLKYGLLFYFVGLMILQGVNYFGDHMQMYQTNGFTQFYIKFKHVAVLLVPLCIPRFFCKYLCFQKGGYNLLNRILPVSKIIRLSEVCINCRKCDRVCPMQLQPSQHHYIVGNDCLSCFNCLDKDICPPNKKALNLQVWGKKRSPIQFGLLVLGIYILFTMLCLYFF
jgi:polyferredoxin